MLNNTDFDKDWVSGAEPIKKANQILRRSIIHLLCLSSE